MHLELRRKFFLLLEKGDVASGTAPCLRSGNGLVGLRVSQVIVCVWTLLSKRRVCVHFGKKIRCLGVRF